jgi:hypothetical protein
LGEQRVERFGGPIGEDGIGVGQEHDRPQVIGGAAPELVPPDALPPALPRVNHQRIAPWLGFDGELANVEHCEGTLPLPWVR